MLAVVEGAVSVAAAVVPALANEKDDPGRGMQNPDAEDEGDDCTMAQFSIAERQHHDWSSTHEVEGEGMRS